MINSGFDYFNITMPSIISKTQFIFSVCFVWVWGLWWWDMNSGLNNHSGAFLSSIYVSKSPKSNFYIDSIEYQRPCDYELHKLSRIQGLVRWLSQCVKVLSFPAIHLTLILGPRIEENCFGHIVLWPSHAHRKREKEKKNTESWALVQGTFHDSQSVPSVSW